MQIFAINMQCRKFALSCFLLIKRPKILSLLLLFLCSAHVTAFSQQDKKIHFAADKENLAKVLDRLAQSSGVNVIYPSSEAGKFTVSLSSAARSIDDILRQLLHNTTLDHKFLKGKAVVFKKKEAAPEKPTAEITVRGIVTDEENLPLAGITVFIKGTQQGTATNNGGSFQLSNVPGDAVIGFSGVGYQNAELPASGWLRVALMKSGSLMENVTVNTGYQTLPKERATGSFVKIDNDLLERRVSTNIMDRLDGITSGLMFNRSSTEPPSISIRGNSTIYADKAPLIVLDGFPYDGDINHLNPNDVEDITVLKDAAAASIWGVRAGNGVIVVNTKKGRLNQPLKVSFNTNLTIGQKPDVNYLPLLSANSFIDMEQALFDANFYAADEANTVNRLALSPVVELLIAKRDGKVSAEDAGRQLNEWRKNDVREQYSEHFLRRSVNQQYALNFTGGTEKLRYLFSAGYDKNQSGFAGDDYQRVTLRSENTYTPVKKLQITAGLMYVNSHSTNNNPGLTLLTSNASRKGLYPYAQLADDDGTPLAVYWQYRHPFIMDAESKGLLNWQYRPIEDLNHADQQEYNRYARLTTGINYQFTPSLAAFISYQYEHNDGRADKFYNPETFYTRNLINSYSSINAAGAIVRPIPLGGIRSLGADALNAHTARAQLNFNRSWNNRHEVVAIGGVEVKESKYNNYGIQTFYGYDNELLISPAIDYVTLYRLYYSTTRTAQIPGGNQRLSEITNRYRSYYTNASYTFAGRYTFSGSARMDASNLFGIDANKRKVPLWSAGMLWNVAKEPFFNSSFLSKLVARATYGFNGNIDKSVTAYTTTQRFTDRVTRLPRADVISPPNDDLRWEKIKIINIGVDFAITNNVLSGSLEWYSKAGTDLLGFQFLDPTVGLSQFKGNVASMRGSGFDLQLQSRNIDQEFKWYTTFLLSHTRDKVTRMNFSALSSLNVVGQSGLFSGTSLNIIPIPGNAVYGLYSYRYAGLDANGDPQGLVDGVRSTDYSAIISAPVETLVYHGSSRPIIFGGLSNTFSYKKFSLFVNMAYKLGYSFRKSSVDYPVMSTNWTGHSDFDKRWQHPGDEAVTNVPSLPLTGNSNRNDFYKFSEVNIINGSHIRLQDIQLSYDLNRSAFKNAAFDTMQFYVYAANLGILWRANDDGIDPDYNPEPESVFLPPAKTVALGIKVSF